MRVIHLTCGAFANESERRALKAIQTALTKVARAEAAFILTNLTHPNQRGQADEIDMVVLGPGGAVVVEVKHWDGVALRGADSHAELITAKAKRVAGRLKAVEPTLSFIPGAFLLTRENGSLRRNGKQPERLGVRAYALKDVDELIKDVAYGSGASTERLAHTLAPRQADLASPLPRRFGRFDELKPLSRDDERFARVFAARDPSSGDRVSLHTYDLSAAPFEKADMAERLAKREFDVVQRFQKSPHLPSLVDSWQPLSNYDGEVYFFTLADSAAVPISTLAKNAEWGDADRLSFAVEALRALGELQRPDNSAGEPLVHRSLDPENIRVRANGTPLFAGWGWARLPLQLTIAPGAPETSDPYAAPEVRQGGLAVATTASDVWSLSKVLAETFVVSEHAEVLAALDRGMLADPSQRATAEAIAADLEVWITLSTETKPASVSPDRWDEGHEFEWRGKHYRVISVLGQGGVARTFKLEELDGLSSEPVGTFVGKVAFNSELGERALLAYKKVRSLAPHEGLSGVLETSTDWRPDELMALLRWTRGEPLDAWRGELDFLTEVSGDESVEALVLRWFRELCSALAALHVQGWVHGDVSPSNILVDDGRVFLIDYDLAGREDEPAASPGTAMYASPQRLENHRLRASDDVFSVAASLFHVLTGRSPSRAGKGGLPWTDDERTRWKSLVPLLDNAVQQNPDSRFADAGAAVQRAMAETALALTAPPAPTPIRAAEAEPLRPNVVPRVQDILSAYPGSRFGNAETRGLDTQFAFDTYVETGLDLALPEMVRAGAVSLVVLCGNAGDGKTAFLQHLAEKLGAGALPSRNRVWEGKVNGRELKINLDGAASWNGKSANNLLDELFAPFQQGAPTDARAHLVAVNDGRLLEWIDHVERGNDGEPTPLTEQLTAALSGNGDALAPHIRLIELNQRSLVGGVNRAAGRISAEFVDSMIERLVGGDSAPDVWRPCENCTAKDRCPMRQSALMMGASRDPRVLEEGRLLRERLTAGLQAVHQRNEVHITARELKAALSYILFGLFACEDLHADPSLILHHPADHAFDADSLLRQGELLRELARLDPGLEAHAKVDRYLRGHGPPDPCHGARRFRGAERSPLPLRRARRRAYLGWTDAQIQAVGGAEDALSLKDGRYFAKFRDFPLLSAAQQSEIKIELCEGLSRLELLPEAAFHTSGTVPIRIVPRTPTETAFWVSKSMDRFDLEPEKFAAPPGLETLHRFLRLSYRPQNGPVEWLDVSLELFGLLMELADGSQIMDAFSDDVFANLGVFTQRLAQEDERALSAWNPAEETAVFSIGIESRDGVQLMVMSKEEA
ncbi:serine/threonine protein kinase/NERD domain-containing protein (plasmid) [Rhizobium phaseoli]|uniref:NERD domain-containing protein kinase family protein n=1 Tax=Rhizobium phaseoli TaxID=396 RepID=UPI0007EA21AD|nr:NERD domain-containing protein kinase family protein [Rhizobium phaseoli]ANL49726.1 serine/threonine protein kinase/NERD domain-containing protein [Rhizobium phaseoli]